MVRIVRTIVFGLLAGLAVDAGYAVGAPLAAAAPAEVPLVSESKITVSGAGIAGETYSFSEAHGDWFSTATDGHAALTLMSPAGAHRAQLSLQWDGKGLTQTITNANNSDVGGNNRYTFYLHLLGTGAYQQTAQPRGGDAIKVTVTRMDDQALEATIAGSATGAGPLRISGVIKLRKAGGATVVASAGFGDCDAQIHDKLAGAEARSPSECEVKFDTYVRQTLVSAVGPVVDSLTKQSWVEIKKPNLGPITAIARNSEKAPYKLQSTHEGAVGMSLAMAATSPGYQKYNQPVADAMKKMGAGGADAAGAMAEMQEAGRTADANTKVTISLSINEAMVGITNFKNGHTVTPVMGGFAVVVPYAQAATGGDISAAQQATYVFVGAFAPAGSKAGAGGAEQITVAGNLNAGKEQFAVQNVRIRIQASKELAEQVMGLVDWAAIQRLMTAK
jgi:hypothetical protein